MSKKTLVLGASNNPERYSFMAVSRLIDHQHEAIPVGIKSGNINGRDILIGRPTSKNIHTVSLYVGPARQPEYYDYIISLSPKRVIFNPGTENAEFSQKLSSLGIEVVEGCTLVMLASGQF